jgi:hypothetical protein
MTPEATLERDGVVLPTRHPAVGTYVMAARTGSLLFVSGHGGWWVLTLQERVDLRCDRKARPHGVTEVPARMVGGLSPNQDWYHNSYQT